MSRDQRRLAAIVCADVVGYSRLMQRDESGTLAALKAHRRELVDPKIAEHGGRIVKTTGDGLLVEFPSVVDALHCAVEVQRGMVDRNADVPDNDRIRFRIGINVGDIIVDDGDIFGDGVNAAARLETLADAGGICVSRAVRDHVEDKVAVPLTHVGAADVKNMAPIDVYKVEVGSAGASGPAQARTARSSLYLPRRRWLLALAAILVAGLAIWTTHRSLAPSAPAPYSVEDRRLTYAVIALTAPQGDAASAKVASALTGRLVASLEARPLWAQVVSGRRVDEALARHATTKAIAHDLDVHFLLRGSVEPNSGGHDVNVLLVDGAADRVVERRSFALRADEPALRTKMQMQDIVGGLTFKALQIEVQRGREKPDRALDVRDLSFRAYVEWVEHKGRDDERGAYVAAAALLSRALALSPDDALALNISAIINLCECVEGWSKNVEEQRAIGEAAIEKALRANPNSTSMVLLKADLLLSRRRFDESLALVESVLSRDPDNLDAISVKAQNLLKLGKLDEAAAAIDIVVANDDEFVYAIVAAAIHYAAGHYERSAVMAQRARSSMRKEYLASPAYGTVTLTLIASQARLGRMDQAGDTLTDFRALVPVVQTVSQVKTWMHPNAELAGFEPLYEGLRLAGMPD